MKHYIYLVINVIIEPCYKNDSFGVWAKNQKM